MSTYLPNSNDYIPALQPFNPDLNFYAGVLSTKQSQYDQGLNKLSSIYSSAFNSPMVRGDNIERRDKYFKTIEQNIQKVAGMDLSIDQNVSSAKTLFDPILNDQHIVKDMVYTKGLQNSYQRAEQFRNCVDPEKCGGEYWGEGVQALEYAKEEFQRASADDSLRYTAPEYTPYQNVTRKAIKAAKDSGFNVSYDYKSADGRYMVTDTNGQLLLGPDGQGVLPQYLYGLFGNDSSVQKMYSTQAYVQRKNYAKSNAARFNGSEDQAESEYLHNIMLQAVPKINKAKTDLTELLDQTNVDKKALEILAKTNPSDDVAQAYEELQRIIDNTEPTLQYHEQVTNLIETAPNLNDLKSLRSRVDNVVANANFMGAINAAATEYAMGTSKHEQKADPYALAAYNNALDLSKSKQLKNYDNQIWKEQQSLLGNIEGFDQQGNVIPTKQNAGKQQAIEAIIKNNVSQEDLTKLGVTKLDKEGMEKVVKAGLLNKENTDVVQNFANISTEAEPFQNTYYENSKVVNAALDNAVAGSKDFVKGMLSSMINSYKNADATEGKNAIGVKAKLLVDIKSILNGTGVDYNALVRGEIPLDSLNDKVSLKMAATAKEIRTKSVASRVYTDGYDDTSLAKMQADNQAAEGLYKQRNLDLTQAVSSTLAEKINAANQGDLSPVEYQKQQALYTSFVNPNGGMVTPSEAKARYVKAAFTAYGGVPNPNPQSQEEDNYYQGLNNKAYAAASAAFDANYVPALKEINSKLTNFDTKTRARSEGGMSAVENAVEKRFNGNLPLDPNTQYVKNILLDLGRNANNNPIVISGAGRNGEMISSNLNASDPDKQELFSKVLDRVKTGDTKDLNISTQIQFAPKTYDKSAFSFQSTTDKAIYTDPSNPNAFPGTFTPDAVMMKMTIGEEEYKKMKGLKSDDVVTESDRSFSIRTVPNDKGFPQSLTPFLQGIQKSPQDIYMQKPGNSIAIDLGDKGKGLVQRLSNGNLQIVATAPVFDDETGEWEDKKITYDVPEQKLENAYPVLTGRLNNIYNLNRNAVTLYTNHARTSQSK